MRRSDDKIPEYILYAIWIIFCTVIAALKLGDDWYEILLRIAAFLLALSIAFTVYSKVTDIIVKANSRIKRLYHFIMILLFPLIIYVALKIYLI